MDDYEHDYEDGSNTINQEDCWEVISAYFEEKGLVRQQVGRAAPAGRADAPPPVSSAECSSLVRCMY